jgi:large subunit ribosomal protein L9
MKVILLKNITKIGQKGDVKDLKEGYVRNSLLPRGMAKIATDGELRSLIQKNQKENQYLNAELAKVAAIFKKLDQQIIELIEKKNEKGHLFARVGKDEIIRAVQKSMGVQLDTSWFDIQPIKEVGDFPVSLKYQNISKSFIIRVI